MTQPLRKQHLWTWVVAAIVIAAAFITSLGVRRTTTPVNPGLHWSQTK